MTNPNVQEKKKAAVSPLNTPFKLSFHSDKVYPLLAGDYEKVTPVTVHFSPTLYCRHDCYFCSYGLAKKIAAKMHMTLKEAIRYLDELASINVRGIIFTGGGDPTQHPDLFAMMEHCHRLGMSYSLNTNGLCLTPELSRKIMTLDPEYVRLSINAGSQEVQELMSGQKGFDDVLSNLEALLENKLEQGCNANIVVACVVGIVNYLDIENLCDRVSEVARRVRNRHGLKHLPVDINIRPIYNYAGSKIQNEEIHNKITGYLKARSEEDLKSYEEFLAGAQTPARVLDAVIDTIENKIKPKLEDTDVNLFYPREKMKAVGTCAKKPYDSCLGQMLYGFLMPSGKLYHCVEWAGTPGYEIGDLSRQSAREIMESEERMRTIERTNCNLHKDCAAVCAYHEMNIYLKGLVEENKPYQPWDPELPIPQEIKKAGLNHI